MSNVTSLVDSLRKHIAALANSPDRSEVASHVTGMIADFGDLDRELSEPDSPYWPNQWSPMTSALTEPVSETGLSTPQRAAEASHAWIGQWVTCSPRVGQLLELFVTRYSVDAEYVRLYDDSSDESVTLLYDSPVNVQPEQALTPDAIVDMLR